MEKASVIMEVEVELDNVFFDDIICMMLEGGSTWIDHVIVKHPDGGKRPRGIYRVSKSEWASDAINKGGEVIFYPKEESGFYILNKKHLLQGLRDWMREHPRDLELINEDGKFTIDAGNIDCDIADGILQFALFSKLIYG